MKRKKNILCGRTEKRKIINKQKKEKTNVHENRNRRGCHDQLKKGRKTKQKRK
jgi:hypothetical protein